MVLFIVITLLMLFSYKFLKNERVTISIGILFLLLYTQNSINGISNSLFSVIKSIVNNQSIILLFIIVGLIYIISELLVLLGFDIYLKKRVLKYSDSWQKRLSHIDGFFSTNFDPENGDYISKYDSIYKSSSFINASLNIFSIPNLYMLFLIIPIISIGNYDFLYIFMGYNFFAIFWFFKRFIDIKYSNIEYKTVDYLDRNDMYDTKREILVDFTKFMRNLFIYLIISIASIFGFGFIFGLIIGILLVAINTIYLILYISYKEKKISEKVLYVNIFYALKKILLDFINIFLGSIYIYLLSETITQNIFVINGHKGYYLLFLILISMLVMYVVRKYYMGLIFILPLLIPLLNVTLDSYQYIYCVIVILNIYIIQHFLNIRFSFDNNKQVIISSIYEIIVCTIAFLLLFNTLNLFIVYLFILVMLIIYLFIVKFVFSKVSYEKN